jgi:hypothetical protein
MFKPNFLPKIDKVEKLIPNELIGELDDTIDLVIDSFKIRTFSPIIFQKPPISLFIGFSSYLLEKNLITIENYNNFSEYYDREIWNLSQYLLDYLKTDLAILIPYITEFYGIDFIKSPFKSIEILEDVLNNFIVRNQIELSYKSYKIRFNIFYNPNNKFDITDYLSFLLKGLIILVYLCEKYDRKKEIEIFLMPTKFKKQLHKGDYIGPKSINSGFCVNGEQPKIYIFRDEEKDKVLIHEIIHALGFDEHSIELDNFVKKLYGLSEKSVNIVSEAWVDFWAIVFNSIINGYLLGEDPNKLLMIEREYSIKQAYEILKKLEYNLDELINLEGINNNGKFSSSSAISYYIIKSGLLLDNLVFKGTVNKYILNLDYVKEVSKLIIGKIIKEKLVLDRIIGGLRENDLRMTYIDIFFNGNDSIIV